MSSPGWRTAVLVGLSLGLVTDARAEPPPSSLEAFAIVGPTLISGDPAIPQATDSFRRVGVYGELGAAYRSAYFIDPFLSVGYGSLAAGETQLPDGAWGAAGTMSQHLGMWFVSPGITADLWRFRLRLGLGLAFVVQSNSFHDDDNSSTQLAMAAQAGVGFNLHASSRFRVDVETTLITAAGAGVTFGVLGITARGDLLQFH